MPQKGIFESITTQNKRSHLMGFKIREIQADAKITDQELLEAIEITIPHLLVEEIVENHGLRRQRQRKLSAELGVILAVGMNLWAKQSLSRVLIKLLKGLRFIWPDPTVRLASKGAISQLRYEIGARIPYKDPGVFERQTGNQGIPVWILCEGGSRGRK